MDKFTPLITILIILLPLVPLAFWLWMTWDLANNNNLPRNEKLNWTWAFLFLNVFAAIFYYFTEYRKRD
jgi:amino acid transporter